MRSTHITAGLLALVIAATPTFAQETTGSEATGSYYINPEPVSTGRLIAGVREYPPRVLRSLLQLAEEPLVLRQLAEEPDLLERPQGVRPPISSALQDAIRELASMPAVVSVAADHPEELEALRARYAESPVETEQDVRRLRADYDYAQAAAAGAWQQVLEQDPAAFEEYRKLVTDFCKAQRQAYPEFPCVEVFAREYYYACPPNEAIVLYAIENADSSAAMRAIDQWWRTYSPDELDARILGETDTPVDFELRAGTVAALPPEQRVTMSAPLAGDDSGAAYLVPVIMQPPADMPPEARYARAIAEHARLWTPFAPFNAEEQPYAEVRVEPEASEWATEPVTTGDRPAITIEDLGVWDGEEPTDDYMVDEWTYTEEPETRVVYVEDDDWDYTPSAWDYAPSSYTYVTHYTHHRYYAPLAVYYCGYTVDWPLFYWCEPSWLVRLRICIGYYGHGYRSHWHPYYHGRGGFSAYFDFGRRHHDHYRDSRRYHGYRSVRVGKRRYYRFAPDRMTEVLRDYGSRRHSVYTSSHAGVRRTWSTSRSGRGRAVATGSRGRRGSSYRDSRGLSSRSTPSIVTSRRGVTSSRGSRIATRRPVSANPRSLASSTRGSDSIRSPRVSTRRPTSATPRTVTSPRRLGDTRRSSDVSSRRGSSRRATGAVSPRSGTTPRRGVGTSTRRRLGSTPKHAVSPRGSATPRRIPATSPRTRTSPTPRSNASPRSTGAPNRGSGVSTRPRSTSTPRGTASPRRTTTSRRGTGVSPRPRTGSSSRGAVSPRPSRTARRSSGVSSRPRTSTSPRSSASPRRNSAPRSRSGVSSRPRSTSRPKTSVSPRRGAAPRRSAGVSSRPKSNSRPKSSASPRRSNSPRRSSGVSSRPQSNSRPKSSVSPRRSNSPRRSSGVSSRPKSNSRTKSSASPRRGGSSSRSKREPGRRP